MASTRVKLPGVGRTVDPVGNPTGTLKTLMMLVVGFTFLLYSFTFAQNRGVPALNQLFSAVPILGQVLSTGQNGESVEVF